MIDPFTFYSRMMSAAFDMAATAQRTTEMLTASQEVIAKRTTMMGEAVRSPVNGDYTELGRMVPEKIDAFAKAGAAMSGDWWAIQSAMMSEARAIGLMAIKGQAPTFTELSAMSTRNANLALRTFERASAIGGKGLRPIHASATANAKRLRTVKPKSGSR
jgi:hypothetical protein